MLEPMPAASRATAAELALLGEDSRYELIHGEISEKASPRIEHSRAQFCTSAWLGRRFDREAGGKWPGGWWLGTECHVEYETHEVYCHDLVGWRRDRVPELPVGWPVRVRPDWAAEILSPGHEKRDRVDKLGVLASAGVPHYWILDEERGLLSIYRHTAGGYLLLPPLRRDQIARAEPFDAVELAIAVLFGDQSDEE